MAAVIWSLFLGLVRYRSMTSLMVGGPPGMGGMMKILEAVRQLQGTAHPAVQVPNCRLALAHGTGGSLGTRHGSATLILERA